MNFVKRVMDKRNSSDTVPSPCIRHCCLNNDDICLGCFRSINEITDWHHASNDERLKIMANTRQRQQDAR